MSTVYRLGTVSHRGYEFPVMEIEERLIHINHGYDYLKRETGKRDLFNSKFHYTLLDILNDWEIFDEDILPTMADYFVKKKDEKFDFVYTMDEVSFLPPVNLPGKVLNAGSNYYDHALEMGAVKPVKEGHEPYFFYKGRSHTIIGHNEEIVLTERSNYIDWEAEVAIVMAKKTKNVALADARNYVAGYTIYNDISARDRMIRKDETFDYDWFSNKGNDTFGPLGPFITPAKFVSDPDNLKVDLFLNGEHMQDTNTNLMVWNVAELVEAASAVTTLDPGDVIATGTGAGVGMAKGIKVKHGEIHKVFEHMYSGGSIMLKEGDEIVINIQDLGSLRNVVAEGP